MTGRDEQPFEWRDPDSRGATSYRYTVEPLEPASKPQKCTSIFASSYVLNFARSCPEQYQITFAPVITSK